MLAEMSGIKTTGGHSMQKTAQKAILRCGGANERVHELHCLLMVSQSLPLGPRHPKCSSLAVACGSK